MDKRVRELDAERDPLSLPEEIVSEASKAGQRVGIPSSTDDDAVWNITDLQNSPIESLLEIAKDFDISEAEALGKQN